jgi:hypothetical protein
MDHYLIEPSNEVYRDLEKRNHFVALTDLVIITKGLHYYIELRISLG